MEQRTIAVQGMTCDGCEARVSRSLQQVDGIRAAAADHEVGEVRIAFEPGEVQLEAIKERIRETGYHTPA